MLVTELQVIRALGCPNPHRCAGPDGPFPKVLNARSSDIAAALVRMSNLSLGIAQAPKDWRRSVVTSITTPPPHITDPRQFKPISFTSVVYKILETNWN